MKSSKSFSIVSVSLGLLLLSACSGNQTANPGNSPATPVASAPATESKSASPEKHSEANKGGQVIESGTYHSILRTIFEAEAETRILPLQITSLRRLKPAFHRQRFKIVRTVDHLEFVPEKEAEGTHLDFYLQKGSIHEVVSTAKVVAQVQLPDGTQKSLDMKYDPVYKHYTSLRPGTIVGEHKVATLSDVGGEKVNGRFRFTKQFHCDFLRVVSYTSRVKDVHCPRANFFCSEPC